MEKEYKIMKVTIIKDVIDPFYAVLFTIKNLHYLDDIEKRIVDFTEDDEEKIRKFTKEMDSIQNWLEQKFNFINGKEE